MAAILYDPGTKDLPLGTVLAVLVEDEDDIGAFKDYKDAGGSYSGPKKSNNKLRKWGRQKWQYAGKKGESRYLPKKAIAALSPSERAATNRKKKADTRAGKQFSKQPKSISNKTRRYRV